MLAKQLLGITEMNGESSVVQNGQITINNPDILPTLQGGKIQFSQRSRSIAHCSSKSISLGFSSPRNNPLFANRKAIEDQDNQLKNDSSKLVLPVIKSVRNSGMAGTQLHAVHHDYTYKPTIEKIKFVPVNHFITNNQVYIQHNQGLTDFAPDLSTHHALGHSPSMSIFGEKKPAHLQN